jgi:hypothetical protein
MLVQKIVKIGSFLLCLLLMTVKVHAKSDFPKITWSFGKTFWNTDDTQQPVDSKSFKFSNRGSLLTFDKSQIKVDISKDLYLFIFPNSEIEFPAINLIDGLVSQVNLKSGKVLVFCKLKCDQFQINTSLSKNTAIEGEFVIQYRHDRPAVKVFVISGETSFSGLEHEEKATISSNKSAEFVGEFDHAEIAVDILLHGKKIVKGKLGELAGFSKDEFRDYFDFLDVNKRKQIVAASKPKRAKNQICEAPFAKFNDCVWRCLGPIKNQKCQSSCVRERCDANGKWSDRQSVNQRRCDKVNQSVMNCDY